MKIWAFSDLHLEYAHLGKFSVPDADVCVVAGDISNRGVLPSLSWLEAVVAPHMPVVFVPGNHEFYRASIVESRKEAREAAAQLKNVYLLDDASVCLDGVLFVGATLWTDLKLHGDPDLAARIANDRQTGMNDYKRIKYQKQPWRRFSPYLTAEMHRTSKAYISDALAEHCGKKVVVTHHAPSALSIPDDKKSDIISAMYASRLDDMILSLKPDFWFHGHIHSSSDYIIGDTRIVSNPRGYGDHEDGTTFNPNLILHV